MTMQAVGDHHEISSDDRQIVALSREERLELRQDKGHDDCDCPNSNKQHDSWICHRTFYLSRELALLGKIFRDACKHLIQHASRFSGLQ